MYILHSLGHGEVIQSCLEGDWIGSLFQTMSALLAKRNRQQMLNLIQSTETSTKQIGSSSETEQAVVQEAIIRRKEGKSGRHTM